MPRFLILTLQGPMQAWGTHTYEDFRPSNLFPTRSGLLGLLGACMGIERQDGESLEALANSVQFAVRIDERGVKLTDFHTVLAARKVDGKPNPNPVVSRREYLYDAAFTVAISEAPNAEVSLDALAEAVRKPCYTPVLGRRSCPLSRPLFERWQEAIDIKAALNQALPGAGLVYVEGEAFDNKQPFQIRDVPMGGKHRRFATRKVYVHGKTDQPCS